MLSIYHYPYHQHAILLVAFSSIKMGLVMDAKGHSKHLWDLASYLNCTKNKWTPILMPNKYWGHASSGKIHRWFSTSRKKEERKEKKKNRNFVSAVSRMSSLTSWDLNCCSCRLAPPNQPFHGLGSKSWHIREDNRLC